VLETGLAADGMAPNTGGAFNDAGEIAGWAAGGRVYWWSSATGWLPVPVPVGATLCQILDGLNNNGEIVGKCVVGGVTYGYYWKDHSTPPVRLPTPPGVTDPAPRDINDAGVIVSGSWRFTPNGSGWTTDKLPDAGAGADAYSVADDGTIAGTVNKNGGHGAGPLPAVWPQGGAYQLLALPAGWGEALQVRTGQNGIIVVGANRTAGVGMRWRSGL
jgi:hypothetical protein